IRGWCDGGWYDGVCSLVWVRAGTCGRGVGQALPTARRVAEVPLAHGVMAWVRGCPRGLRARGAASWHAYAPAGGRCRRAGAAESGWRTHCRGGSRWRGERAGAGDEVGPPLRAVPQECPWRDLGVVPRPEGFRPMMTPAQCGQVVRFGAPGRCRGPDVVHLGAACGTTAVRETAVAIAQNRLLAHPRGG